MGVTDKLSVRYINVFRLDMEDLSWTSVQSLGYRAFFLDTDGHTTSCSVTNEESRGIKGNCIYMIEPQDEHLYRYDLEDTSLVVTLPFPERIKNWVENRWVMPMPNKRWGKSVGR
ncbi:hypothetical protein ACH5RR_024663 [Cinchona calisaya]|uniref:KIB1-4 beta-propeller domain-containing protein n=1 Tax=Cinchona calisaya TaxID=153742 RepID=A0ABD2YZE9_9GENT